MRYKCDCSQLNAQMSQVIGADKQTFTKQVCFFNNTLKKDHKYWLLCFVYLYRVFRPEKLSGNLIYVFNLRSVKSRMTSMTSMWKKEAIKEKIWKLESTKNYPQWPRGQQIEKCYKLESTYYWPQWPLRPQFEILKSSNKRFEN